MKKIMGQVIYLGPNCTGLQLNHSTIFRDGVYESFYQWFKECPALRELFVPMDQCAIVRKQLNFVNRQMLGTSGKYVVLYSAVQKWIASKSQTQPGVKVQTNA